MLQDLDATLRSVLTDPAAPSVVRSADVSFTTPDKDFTPAVATVDLFLHEVSENRSLREASRVVERAGRAWTNRTPPLRLDCTYLVTAWSSEPAGVRAHEEHRLLGSALSWLVRFPVLEDRHLHGALRPRAQDFPTPMTVAQTREGHGLADFWSALGIAPRPAFPLTVTVAVSLSDTAVTVPELERIRLDSTSIQHPALSGRVLDAALAPVVEAAVAVVGVRDPVAVGPTGGFSFPGLPDGSYVLLVQSPGRHDTRQPVEHSAHSQIHDVILPST